jgi:hypothetical protein
MGVRVRETERLERGVHEERERWRAYRRRRGLRGRLTRWPRHHPLRPEHAQEQVQGGDRGGGLDGGVHVVEHDHGAGLQALDKGLELGQKLGFRGDLIQ